MPVLRVLRLNQPEETYPLVGEQITVGRRPENTIQIVDPSVSARHAEFLQVGDHYRLHDLGSTNLSFVEGAPVTDFHLHQSCQIVFGTVTCEYDAAAVEIVEGTTLEPGLTPDEMEKDFAFLRSENLELSDKIAQLQRQIDILSSARLVTGRGDDPMPDANLLEIKRLREERDAARYQNSGLQLELEKLRQELSAMSCERDDARRAYEQLQGERVAREERLESARTEHAFAPVREDNKGATQRIVFPQPAPAGARE